MYWTCNGIHTSAAFVVLQSNRGGARWFCMSDAEDLFGAGFFDDAGGDDDGSVGASDVSTIVDDDAEDW